MRLGPVGARVTYTGPEIGEQAPSITLADMATESLKLQIPPTDGRDYIVIFLSPNCPACQVLVPGIKALFRETRSHLGWALVILGHRSECELYRKSHGLYDLIYCHGADDIIDLYAIRTTPYAIFIRSDGHVLAKGLVNNIEHLESLLSAGRVSETAAS